MIEKTNARAPGSNEKQLFIAVATRAGAWRGREAGGGWERDVQADTDTQAPAFGGFLESSPPLPIHIVLSSRSHWLRRQPTSSPFSVPDFSHLT